MTLHITIVGLGLTGSSIGLSLKQNKGQFQITGHDKDSEAAKRAFKAGCVDRTEWNLLNACDGADLVVLSIPLTGIRNTLTAIAQELKPGCVVTDTASLKVPVLNWAHQSLPVTVSFVGGHPILEKVSAESEQPTADLFAGATWCLTPDTNAPQEALQMASDLVEVVGARPYYLDAAEHDGLVAAVEQLPLLSALALQALAGTSPSHREMIQLSGRSFESGTHLLAGDAENLSHLCIQNAANITRWLDVLQSELSRFREFVANQDNESLQKAFDVALSMRGKWMDKHAEGGQTVDYSDFSMMHMLLGNTFRSRGPKGE